MKRITYISIIGARGGQALVEFALILTLILALLMGVIEFGRAWFYSNTLVNGVRAGARYASELSNSTAFSAKVITYTKAQITAEIPQDNLYVNVSAVGTAHVPGQGAPSTNTGNLASGDSVKVFCKYDFEVLGGSIIPHFSGTKVLTKQATMRHE